MSRKITITEEQADFIKNNLHKMSVKDIAKELGFSESKIYNNMLSMKLECVNGYSRKFVNDEVFFNESNYENWIV